jgi:hydroxypyruvate isomerase
MPNRRRVLQTAAGAFGMAAMATLPAVTSEAHAAAQEPKRARSGNVKQSIVAWCFSSRGEKWSPEKICQVAVSLGCPSVELINPEHWGLLKKHKLTCAIASNGMPGAPYMRGFNNTAFHGELRDRMTKTIDLCVDAGVPSIIAFVGYKWKDPEDPKSGAIPTDEALANCVKGLKDLAGYAEKKGVTVCVEHLNTRDNTDPMKGHPGYQGDDLDFCAEIIRKVGSPRMKLLFDIYHVQVMHGDLIRRIDQTKDIIGHIHTAGVPGRGELDESQEINYPAVMKKLVQIGYKGYVGQEFIPTRDPLAGLKQAVELCDV